MSGPADLIEEVARMHGYDSLPSTLPLMEMTKGAYTPVQSKAKYLRHLLADLGLHEVVTYTLTSKDQVNDFNIFHQQENIALMSPLSSDHAYTRKSVIPSLLQTIAYNQSHALKDIQIFELSNTYAQDEEIYSLNIACTGTYHTVAWAGIQQKADFYLVKGLVDTILSKLNIEPSRYTLKPVEEDQPYFHPGRSGYLYMGKNIIGVIGEIHPRMAKKYDVKETYVASLNLSVLLQLRTRALKYEAIPMYPSVTRDIALVMDASIPTQDVIMCIKKAGKRLVSDAQIFDVYQGEHIEEGKKSVAISLTFTDPTKTLDEKTVQSLIENILKAVEKDYQATLRG